MKLWHLVSSCFSLLAELGVRLKKAIFVYVKLAGLTISSSLREPPVRPTCCGGTAGSCSHASTSSSSDPPRAKVRASAPTLLQPKNSPRTHARARALLHERSSSNAAAAAAGAPHSRSDRRSNRRPPPAPQSRHAAAARRRWQRPPSSPGEARFNLFAIRGERDGQRAAAR